MKNFITSFLFLSLILYSHQLDVPANIVICKIGQYEQSIYQQFTSNLKLTNPAHFQKKLKSLLENEPTFKNIKYIQDSKLQTNTLILKNSSCIQTISDLENNIEAFVFLSNNHQIEWKNAEILEHLAHSFFEENTSFSTDLYKIGTNIMSATFSQNKYSYYTFFKHNTIDAIYILNKQTNKLTVFIFKKS